MRKEVMHIRMTTELKEKIQKNAERLGLDTSTFVRMVLSKEVNEEVK
jgi:antitoxin component of RelBE/YafQ-DinJ toxin-antitoxin module